MCICNFMYFLKIISSLIIGPYLSLHRDLKPGLQLYLDAQLFSWHMSLHKRPLQCVLHNDWVRLLSGDTMHTQNPVNFNKPQTTVKQHPPQGEKKTVFPSAEWRSSPKKKFSGGFPFAASVLDFTHRNGPRSFSTWVSPNCSALLRTARRLCACTPLQTFRARSSPCHLRATEREALKIQLLLFRASESASAIRWCSLWHRGSAPSFLGVFLGFFSLSSSSDNRDESQWRATILARLCVITWCCTRSLAGLFPGINVLLVTQLVKLWSAATDH